jgi:hypothetical protein
VPETVAWSAASNDPESGCSTVTLSWIRFRLGSRSFRRGTAHAEAEILETSVCIAALPKGREMPAAIGCDTRQLASTPRGQ